MKYHVYLALKDNLLKIFISDKVKLGTEYVRCGKIDVIKTLFQDFYTLEFKNIVTLIYIQENKLEIKHADFIDVTENSKFYIEDILNGSVVNANTVIEGSDGVGKSTLVANLAQLGILCQDRAVNSITKKMKPEIESNERLFSIQKYLDEEPSRKVIFLYLSSEFELNKRIYSREFISEYDKHSIIFQRLYVDTYMKIKEKYKNIFLLDCLNKSEEDMVKELLGILY